jgi:radical SAM superfamily enzyme YgiQ (UPF0313 family)
MLRVLFVNANTERLPDPVYPLGAATAATAVRNAGHQVRTLDLCFEADGPAALRRALEREPADVLALSLRNLDSSAFPNTRSFAGDYRALVAAARTVGPLVVVLGGSGFTCLPEAVLAACGADYGVVGEGELALPWLLGQVTGAERPVSGDGFDVQWLGRAALVRSSSRCGDLDGLPRVDRSLFDAARYYREGGCLNLQTKRGCAFRCSYCSYPVIEGDRARLRDPGCVVDELEAESARWGAKHWFITDSVFNEPLEHAKAICREIVRRGLDLSWSAYFNPRHFDDELAALLAASGCRDVEFGTDSGSDRMLKALKKGFTAAQLRTAAALCRKHRLRTCQSLLFGAPGEDEESVAETLALMDALNPNAVIAMTGIRIMAGTELERQARGDGSLAPDDDLLAPRFYFSRDLGENVVGLIDRHAKTRGQWIVPGLGVRENVGELRALRSNNVKGQLWPLVGRDGAGA